MTTLIKAATHNYVLLSISLSDIDDSINILAKSLK